MDAAEILKWRSFRSNYQLSIAKILKMDTQNAETIPAQQSVPMTEHSEELKEKPKSSGNKSFRKHNKKGFYRFMQSKKKKKTAGKKKKTK